VGSSVPLLSAHGTCFLRFVSRCCGASLSIIARSQTAFDLIFTFALQKTIRFENEKYIRAHPELAKVALVDTQFTLQMYLCVCVCACVCVVCVCVVFMFVCGERVSARARAHECECIHTHTSHIHIHTHLLCIYV